MKIKEVYLRVAHHARLDPAFQAPTYPSCPKSSVNFCNLTRSSSLTVGFEVAKDRNMSLCRNIRGPVFKLNLHL